MVDVDRRMACLSPAHAAGLRRLSARAAVSHASSFTHRLGILSLRPQAEAILSHLAEASVHLHPGLSEQELARLEADLACSFPPDLRALLALALPSGPGFPDWRTSSPGLLRLPAAAAAIQVSCGSLWLRSWGPRPADPARVLRRARAALRRAPLLLPVYGRCYLPCSPSLVGNPVFYVDDSRIFCCATDLTDFFQRYSASFLHPDLSSALRSIDTARWIEFWTDTASDNRRRNSSSSSSSSASDTGSCFSSSPPADPGRFVEIRTPRLPDWVERYLARVESALRQGGWDESDVREMVHVPTSGIFDGKDEPDAAVGMVDVETALHALLVKADRRSDSFRRAGWRPEEVSDALGLDLRLRRQKERRPRVKLPPSVALKIEKLAEVVVLGSGV